MRLLQAIVVMAVIVPVHALAVDVMRQTGTYAELCKQWLSNSGCKGDGCHWERGVCAIVGTYADADGVCVPDGESLENQAQAFVKWFDSHPETGETHIGQTGPVWMQEAYPCPNQ